MTLRAVHFGAGSIGRGFIGQLLHDSGYEITFIDVDEEIVNQINDTGSYTLYQIESAYASVVIDKVGAISPVSAPQSCAEAIAKADIITTSVLANNLVRVAPTLLEGLRRRTSDDARVNVLACENALGNSKILRRCVCELDEGFAHHIDEIAAFASTEVDRMVLPSMQNGRRTIDIGRDFELAIDRTQLARPEEAPIKGAIYTDDLVRYIERKLFIINGGHAWAGFVGHLHGFTIIQEVFRDEKLTGLVRSTMRQIGRLVAIKHGFGYPEIAEYIDFALGRFETPGITDAISRVCRSPVRKLAASERLVSPAVQLARHGLRHGLIAQGIAAALLYDEPADKESVVLQDYVRACGISEAISHFTGIDAHGALHSEILDHCRRFAAGDLAVQNDEPGQ